MNQEPKSSLRQYIPDIAFSIIQSSGLILPNLKGHFSCKWVDFMNFLLKYTQFYENVTLQLQFLCLNFFCQMSFENIRSKNPYSWVKRKTCVRVCIQVHKEVWVCNNYMISSLLIQIQLIKTQKQMAFNIVNNVIYLQVLCCLYCFPSFTFVSSWLVFFPWGWVCLPVIPESNLVSSKSLHKVKTETVKV